MYTYLALLNVALCYTKQNIYQSGWTQSSLSSHALQSTCITWWTSYLSSFILSVNSSDINNQRYTLSFKKSFFALSDQKVDQCPTIILCPDLLKLINSLDELLIQTDNGLNRDIFVVIFYLGIIISIPEFLPRVSKLASDPLGKCNNFFSRSWDYFLKFNI